MRNPIKRGVKVLLDRVSADGWEPIEPVDPDRLWDAKRINYVYANDFIDSYSGTSRSARLQSVNVNFRRWVPAGAELPVTPGSTSEKAAYDALAKAVVRIEAARKNERHRRVAGRVDRVLKFYLCASFTGAIVALINGYRWDKWIPSEYSHQYPDYLATGAGKPGFLDVDLGGRIAILTVVLIVTIAFAGMLQRKAYTEEPRWAGMTLARGGIVIFSGSFLYGMCQLLALSADKLDPFDEVINLVGSMAQLVGLMAALTLFRSPSKAASS